MLLIGRSDETYAMSIAQRVLHEERLIKEGPLPVGVSIGIATRQSGDTPLKIMHRVNDALDEAKRSGRGRIVCSAPQRQEAGHTSAEWTALSPTL